MQPGKFTLDELLIAAFVTHDAANNMRRNLRLLGITEEQINDRMDIALEKYEQLPVKVIHDIQVVAYEYVRKALTEPDEY